MFIVSKRSYAVRLSDGSFYRIPKDFIGEIPEEVAESRLVQRAVRSGSIAVPSGTRDRELLEADQKAEELQKENDIRPDAGEEAGGSLEEQPETPDAEENKGGQHMTTRDNRMGALFQATKAAAANVPQPGECGSYTADMFREDFPQFTVRVPSDTEGSGETMKDAVPEKMLELFISQANDSVLPGRWSSLWRYAAGLYVAHFAALYLKTYTPGSGSAAQVAVNAQNTGTVKAASMGDTSISYDNSAVTAGTEKWGSWNATQYGSQLVTMARMVGMGGMYVI